MTTEQPAARPEPDTSPEPGSVTDGDLGRILVVTPTYQEAENIEEFLHRVRAAVPDADILVVDDNSPDGTADLVRKVAVELGRIEVLEREKKAGLGTAYRAGFAWGLERGYDVLVQIDADLSHDPAVLPQLLDVLARGADMAIGSRYVPGGSVPHWPLHRRLLSRYGNSYVSFALHLHIHDATAGFRAYKADTLRRIDFTSTRAVGYGLQVETGYRLAKQGGRFEEIPIEFTDRVRGNSKMSFGIFAEELLLVTWWGLKDRVAHLRERIARRQDTASIRS